MTIIEMLNIWAEHSTSVELNTRLSYSQTGFIQTDSSSWGQALDEWEEELDAKITSALNILIYGVAKDPGVLNTSERVAVEHHHIAAMFKSNRTNMDEDYTIAKVKLRGAMVKRGFLVD